jgi:4'-phosphopantetheinyl transferase EntD
LYLDVAELDALEQLATKQPTSPHKSNQVTEDEQNGFGARDQGLHAVISAMALPDVFVDHRIIREGDEHALWPEELQPFANSVVQVRRASGAARMVGRRLLGGLGYPPCALPKSESGWVCWPAGIVGSLAHDGRVAAAAVARRDRITSLGIDVEPAEALPHETLDMVLTPGERQIIGSDGFKARLFFVLKEAAYKAVYPIDNRFLEHHEVEIDSTLRFATLRNGRIVPLFFCIASHIIGVAIIAT